MPGQLAVMLIIHLQLYLLFAMIAAMLKNILMQTLAQVWKILQNGAASRQKGPFLRFMDYVEAVRVLRVCALAAATFILTLSSVTSALGHPAIHPGKRRRPEGN